MTIAMPPFLRPLLAVSGQSHPWPLSTWSTAGNAEGFLGRRSPHRAAADVFHCLLAATFALSLVTAAVAQPPADRQPGGMLKQADTDGDGTVSREEFMSARTAKLGEAFSRMDTNGDAKLDGQEIGAAGERMRPMPGEGRDFPRRPDGPRPERERPPRPEGDRPPRAEGERPPRAEGDRPQRPGGGAMAGEAFDRLDADGDGKLSREEFVDGMARMREFMQRNGPGGPGGLGMPGGPGGRGPEQGFRRPPQQD
jgi:hypothetical protein